MNPMPLPPMHRRKIWGLVWTGTENVTCSKTRLTDHQACIELLYPLPYPGRLTLVVCTHDTVSLETR
jgi:hypothetical protein